MKTLRLRLLCAIGTSFALFWPLSSVWPLINLRSEFRDGLDERLAASDRMVAALVADSLAMTALRNLLDNALRYGTADAPVVLRIHPAAQGVGFSVADQDDGQSDADIALAGNRSWSKGGPGAKAVDREAASGCRSCPRSSRVTEAPGN